MEDIKTLPLRDIKRYMNVICSLKEPEKDYIGSMLVVCKLQEKYKRNKRYEKSEDIFHALDILKSYKYINLIKNSSDFPLIEVTDKGMIFREISRENKLKWIISNFLSIIAIIISLFALFF